MATKGTATTAKNRPQPQQQTKQNNVPAKTKETLPADAELLKLMNEDAGKGVSTDMADNIVPLVYILQANSPGLDRSNTAKYLGKDAKSGDIWFRGQPVFVDADLESEDSGLVGVPCFYSKCFIEWRPNRGGFVARHQTMPRAAVEKEEEREDGEGTRRVWRMPNGNAIQETREYVFMVTGYKSGKGEVVELEKPEPYVIPFVSTNITPAREFMSLMNKKTVPGSSRTAPMWSHYYRIRTENRKDGDNSWYVYHVRDAGEDGGSAAPLMVTDIALYRECKRINEQFAKGELKADAPAEEEQEAGDSGESKSDDM